MDLLENDVLCKNCRVTMGRGITVKDGFKLRSFQCPSCKKLFHHPTDLEQFEQYSKLKDKQFQMKLRIVGNSFCISIPKEIVRFNRVKENTIVSLSMDDPERIGLVFHKIIREEFE